jgi:hypothetical protein
VTGRAELATGVVKVRLMGDATAGEALAAILAACPVVEVIEQSAPYPNRRADGHRLYLTVRVPAANPPACEGASS